MSVPVAPVRSCNLAVGDREQRCLSHLIPRPTLSHATRLAKRALACRWRPPAAARVVRLRILHMDDGAYGLPLWRHGTASTETG